jgi:hypothetical protein
MDFREQLHAWIDTECEKLSRHVRQMAYPRKLATLWYRWAKNEDGLYEWQFNHLEDEHSERDLPLPNHPNQKASWAGGRWAKAHVQLTNEGWQGSAKVGHFLTF